MPLTTTLAFGPMLKHLRKHAGMTQRDLAAALGYSESLICSLETAHRQPDLKAVMDRFVPALGLQDDPQTAAALIERAALARGERPPAAVTLQRTTQVVVQADHAAHATHLPSPPTELIGRAAEVHQLCNRLLGHSGRLMTLVGPPGIGKTTLALAVAARLQPHYRDGAVFVPLAAVGDATTMALAIGAAVGSMDAGPKAPQTRLIEHLRRKQMLLVLDNLEQIRAVAPLVAALVAECPGLCVLATSRERLHLRAEQRCKVPPLDLAPAVDLFAQRAQAIDAGFRCTPQNQATLEAICLRLDCLPLALELCAAQVDLLSPTQLLARLQAHRLDLLVDGAHDLPLHQRSLRTAIDASYALLDEAERSLLRCLGIFMGGCDWQAVAAVAADHVELSARPLHSILHALIDKSLVRVETLPDGEQRFLMLETIREFALEQVRARGEEAHLRRRHYAIYLQFFRTGDSHLRGPDATAWFGRLGPEQDNLRAALQWALDEARYADAAWLVFAVAWSWVFHRSVMEANNWLARLMPHRHTLAADLRLGVLLSSYAFAAAGAAFQTYQSYKDEVMELLAICPDKLLHASAWHWLAMTTPDPAEVNVAAERSIALARADRDQPASDVAWGALGDRNFLLAEHIRAYARLLVDQGRVEQATPLMTESHALFQARGDQLGIGKTLSNLGRIALLRGDLAQADRLLQQAKLVLAGVGGLALYSELHYLLGLVTLYRGNPSEARQLLAESLCLCINNQEEVRAARVCTYLADAALWESKPDEAEHWLRQGLAHHADPQQITLYEVERLFVAARLATAQQQHLARRDALRPGRPGAQPGPRCDWRADARPGRRRAGDGAGGAGPGGLCRGICCGASNVACGGVRYDSGAGPCRRCALNNAGSMVCTASGRPM